MTLSVQVAALLIGAGLLAIAIFGGNIRAKDVEVGPVGAKARIASGVIGALFIAGAFGLVDRLLSPTSETTASASAALGANDPDEREVTIYTYLSDDQIYENTRLLINGDVRLTFSVDKARPGQSLTTRVRPGDRYTLIGSSGMEATVGKGDKVIWNRKFRGDGRFEDGMPTAYSINVDFSEAEVANAFLQAD